MKREVIIKPNVFAAQAGFLLVDGTPENLGLSKRELSLLLVIAGRSDIDIEKGKAKFDKPIKLTIVVEEL